MTQANTHNITGAAASRRSFLTQTASAAAAGAAALLVAPKTVLAAPGDSLDPISAAIEAHRRAAETTTKLILEQSRQEESRRKDVRERSPGKKIVENNLPEREAAEEAVADVLEAENDAVQELANTLPTTIAGVAAILAYAAKHQDDIGSKFIELDDDDGVTRPFEFFVIQNCAKALANMSAAA